MRDVPSDPPRPVFRVVRGKPDDVELAVLLAVLAAAAGGADDGGAPPPPLRPAWARPARYRPPAAWG
ncbi:acyl-CoA carboxylase epsilon subunit [Actinorugispora endophytica]|uniref:Acyl-CoA carboxylase epsilon subunit-like protein n=1 Tax=Actinorugispora endophytica TaxID=1605990 RepID=A0A4R6UMY8_9ACTN|nr:acyl-CoA carboxylase epsilon subunit [Actinorugispora endophytica]TDQ48480.1 acyl-CoA carboxylase epsilon subunit-like protein [Actinorugispora endophytica]